LKIDNPLMCVQESGENKHPSITPRVHNSSADHLLEFQPGAIANGQMP